MGGELGQLLHERDENVFDVDVNVQVRSRVEQLLQSLQMVLVRESLDDTLHQVLLRQGVFTNDDNVENTWQHNLLVDVVGDSLQTAQSYDVLSNRYSQFVPFQIPLLLVFVCGKVLQADPESVHFAHILQNKLD